MSHFAVYVNTHSADPDDDVIAEDVLLRRYADKATAKAEAMLVSRRERTFTMVYDTERVSKITGRDVLIALFENGRNA